MKSAAFLLVLVAALSVSTSQAQQTGDCASGTAEADLDINDVRARVFNGGNLFFGTTTTSGEGYIVPKRAGITAVFAAQFWISGKVGNEVRAAGNTYDYFLPEFWPGPLDEEGNPPEDCSAYDRIYVVSRSDVARYHATSEATDDLRDWPVELGAPVLDGDGVAGNYDLAGGDEPAISGEQMAWWVMNDAGNEHVGTATPPVPMEVRVSAFAAPSPRAAVHRATLYRYRLTYRGSQPLDSAYVALWVDTNLGDGGDDYVGSDTTYDMALTYNAFEEDDVYGVPPALGIQVIQGPVGYEGERVGMTAFQQLQGAGPFNDSDPGTGVEYHRVMRGLWRNGHPMTEGGYGYSLESPLPDSLITTFIWPGDPVQHACWSMEDLCNGYSGQPYDQRFMLSSGPFRMEPGETEEVVFAIPFAQGADRLDSVVKLREAARYLQNAYDLGFFEPHRVAPAPVEPEPPEAFALTKPFPNPFRSATTFTLTVPDGVRTTRLAVYDVLGREVAVLADGVLPPGEHAFTLDGSTLPAGVYFVRLETGRQSATLKLLHIE